MKLLWSSRSPFARKVMIAAHELGIADRIETVRVVVDAANPNPEVTRFNPIGRIPTLILDDGAVIQDSVVIVEYLNSTAGGSLIPAGTERWKVLTLQSLADGVMDSDVRWLEEKRRPPAEQRAPIIDGMRRKIDGALDLIESDLPAGVTVGSVAVASALAHLDFRFPEEPWRLRRPRLRDWYAAFAKRPSMVATEFVDVY